MGSLGAIKHRRTAREVADVLQLVLAATLAGTLADSGVPTQQAELFAEIDLAIERGGLRGGSGDLSRPTTPLAETIAAELRASNPA